jgi:eukaryotic-like serine/threonine-protein kinase
MTGPTPEFTELAAALSGQYELEREIGRGGMGVVYLARDVRLDRRVAIKTLPRHLTDSATRDRFLREARTAASLSHPNIVPIYRADETGGFVYFAMAYVQGESLAERVKARGPLSPREAAGCLRDVAAALGYAHAHGVIHRDVKAENILLEQGSGRAMVTDFGIARVADAAPLTATGHVLGTVHYMSPEQVAGERLDGRTDLYALGVVGFFALSGAFPFDHETASAVLVAHVTKRAPPLVTVAPHAPPALAAVIDRCLMREASSRFATGEDLVRALDVVLALPEIDAAEAAPRVLSETQAQAVWKRASELQALTGTHTPPPIAARPAHAEPARTSGYPLANVRASALEAGISEQFVARALTDLGLAPAAASSSGGALVPIETLSPPAGIWAGAPMKVSYEAKVAGEVRGDDLDMLVEVIRRQLGDVGQVGTLGRSLTWSSTNQKRRLGVTVVPRAGQTTIRVEEHFGQLAGATFGGIVGGVGGGFGGGSFGIVMGLTRNPLYAIINTAVIVAGAYGAARTIFTRTVRARGEELRTLIVRLAEAVIDASAPPRR